MNTCVDFRVIDKVTKPLEEMTVEDFDSYAEFALSLLSSTALSLSQREIRVGNVRAVNKGCAASFLCHVDSVRISCILSIVLESQSMFRCGIASWASRPIWKEIVRLAPTKQQEDAAVAKFCQVLNDVLKTDARLDDFRWWTLEDWCEGKHWESQ